MVHERVVCAVETGMEIGVFVSLYDKIIFKRSGPVAGLREIGNLPAGGPRRRQKKFGPFLIDNTPFCRVPNFAVLCVTPARAAAVPSVQHGSGELGAQSPRPGWLYLCDARLVMFHVSHYYTIFSFSGNFKIFGKRCFINN